MSRFKDITALICMVASFLGAITLIVIVWLTPASSPMVTNLLNIILFGLSSSFAIISGYFFARISTSEKVDTIAEQSTEKMLHLSLQLQHLKGYLQQTLDIADDEATIHPAAAINAYRHRVEAAADMAASLASSNEAFRSDWLGVVSKTTRQAIEKKYDKLRDFLQDAETYERLKTEKSAGAGDEKEEARVEEQMKQVEERIENARKQLPIQQPLIRTTPALPAVSVEQNISSATDTEQSGTLSVRILRPVYRATGAGRLHPSMRGVPWINAEMLSHPPELVATDFRYSPGCGTTFDFSIGLKSTAYGVNLPTGEYVFKYQARFNNEQVTNAPAGTSASQTQNGARIS